MLIEITIAPKRQADRSSILETLAECAPEGERYGVKIDETSDQIVLVCDTEHALEILLARAKDRGLEFAVGAPQIAYRETLAMPLTVRYTHKEFDSAFPQFAEVTIAFEPLPQDSGFVFENEIIDGAIPAENIPAIENALQQQRKAGLLAGFPVTDFRAVLKDGKYHETDSSPLAFDIATRAAFLDLRAKGVVKLQEPYMKLVVTAPEDFLGSVIADIESRRGRIQRTDSDGNLRTIEALVPLAQMFGYRNTLHAATNARASHTMSFSHYEDVPHAGGGGDDNVPAAMALRA
jgi:elongation factor G